MSIRPPVFTWNEELHFGPASEPVHIQSFLDEAEALHLRGMLAGFNPHQQSTSSDDASKGIARWSEWQECPADTKSSVISDCNLDDFKSSLSTVLKSQKHISFLQSTHAAAVRALVSTQTLGKRKGKSKEPPHDAGPEALKQAIEQTTLKMWKLKPAAKPYIRTGHISDQNALTTIQPKGDESPGTGGVLTAEVLITLTAYTRNTWYPYAFLRNSQHVLPSACSLAELWNCIPCILKGDGRMPSEILEHVADDEFLDPHRSQRKPRVVGYGEADSESDLDPVVIVIEDTAYCDGRGTPDYADKLLSHLQLLKPPPADPDAAPPLPPGPYERPKLNPSLQKGPPIHTVPLRSLTLRINEPYWILHRGNCEHWFVVDEIRLHNPRDPGSGYPIEIQRTPTFPSLCRICSKVPATLSILNDVRLGETPAMVCKPCWDLFGGPPQPTVDGLPDDRVIVVPILFDPSYH